MKVETDDLSMMRFYAKPELAIDWTMVFQLDAAGLGFDLTQDSFVPGFGGSNLNDEGEIGFANFWAGSAPRPNPTDEETVLDYTFQGIKYNLKGVQKLDDLNPDVNAALGHLNDASLNYQLARDYIEGNLPQDGENASALGYLGRAIRLSYRGSHCGVCIDQPWSEVRVAGGSAWLIRTRPSGSRVVIRTGFQPRRTLPALAGAG
jgi:hypothetical protein